MRRRRGDEMIEEISGDFLQWLRGFYFVAEKGSVKQAAIAMGREQPTISRQIQCLEKLGVTLFDRSSGRMCITPEGRVLLEEAVALFEDIKRIKGEFLSQELQYEGRIVISTTHAIIDTILPPYIDRFKTLHPRVLFHFEGSMREVIYEKVESTEADFGIAILNRVPKTDRELRPVRDKLFYDWFRLENIEYEMRIARTVHASGLPVPAVGEIIS